MVGISWTPEMIDFVRDRVAANASYSHIARQFTRVYNIPISRSAIASVVSRYKIRNPNAKAPRPISLPELP